MTDLVEEVARALAKEDRIEICSDALYRFSTYGPKARAAIAVVIERCTDAVNGLAYGDAVEAIRKLGESE